MRSFSFPNAVWYIATLHHRLGVELQKLEHDIPQNTFGYYTILIAITG